MESQLSGYQLSGYSLSGYNIKYEDSKNNDETDSRSMSSQKYNQLSEDLYIVELDNHRRKMSFMTPFRSNKENPDNLPDVFRTIELNLKTTPRKFYFAIARDNQIDEVWIKTISSSIYYKDKMLFHPDDKDKDGIYRKIKVRDENGNVIFDDDNNPIIRKQKDYGFYSGDILEIEIRFKNETNSLMKELIPYYLSDCLEPNSISKSNNFVQTINPFIMPQRDVLLFLKTESTYMLNISINEDASKIYRAEHNGETTYYNKREVPIFISHFKDDEIIIEVYFNDPFSEIDREYLKNQLSDVDDIRYNDGERPYTDYVGYDISIPQRIKFLMPARDVILFIRQKDYRNTIRLIRYNPTDGFEKVSVCKDHINIELKEEDEADPTLNGWEEFSYKSGEEITITVHFKPTINDNNLYFYEIDVSFLKSQLASIQVDSRKFKNKDDPVDQSEGFDGPDQSFKFQMPNNDIYLIIKEKTIRRVLTVRPEPYQFLDVSQPRRIKGVICKGKFENALKEFTPDEVRKLKGVSFPIISKEPTIDLYIKFDDIYMHLDKDYIIAQEPLVSIEEAGEYGTYTKNNQIPLPSLVDSNKEYYQHVRLIMPENDFTLTLKWIERLFLVDFIFYEYLVKTSTLKDTNKIYDRYNNENPITLQQFRLPHNTYSKLELISNKTIIDNKVMLNLQFKNEKFHIDPINSYCKVSTDHYIENKIKPLNSNKILNCVLIDENTSSVTIDPMPKFGIKTFIAFWLNLENSHVDNNFGRNSFLLLPDNKESGGYKDTKFTITIAAARGGNGGNESGGKYADSGESGKNGAIVKFKININEPLDISYGLGAIGQNGTSGSAGTYDGGGGGGGGASFLVFDYEVDVTSVTGTLIDKYKSIYLEGGRGGDGGGNDSENDGGAGGWKDERNGNGQNGGGAGTMGGTGGTGGMGFSYNNVVNETKVWKVRSSIFSNLTQLAATQVAHEFDEGYIIIEKG